MNRNMINPIPMPPLRDDVTALGVTPTFSDIWGNLSKTLSVELAKIGFTQGDHADATVLGNEMFMTTPIINEITPSMTSSLELDHFRDQRPRNRVSE